MFISMSYVTNRFTDEQGKVGQAPEFKRAIPGDISEQSKNGQYIYALLWWICFDSLYTFINSLQLTH